MHACVSERVSEGGRERDSWEIEGGGVGAEGFGKRLVQKGADRTVPTWRGVSTMRNLCSGSTCAQEDVRKARETTLRGEVGGLGNLDRQTGKIRTENA